MLKALALPCRVCDISTLQRSCLGCLPGRSSSHCFGQERPSLPQLWKQAWLFLVPIEYIFFSWAAGAQPPSGKWIGRVPFLQATMLYFSMQSISLQPQLWPSAHQAHWPWPFGMLGLNCTSSRAIFMALTGLFQI